jgi:predicted glutamine amidotransferase
MCGILGSAVNSINKLTEEQISRRSRIITALALAMEKRGSESTGIAIVKDNKVLLHKGVDTASKFITSRRYKNLLAKNPSVILGHTRQSSSGIVSQANAHPFEYGTIIGCHNGSVSNDEDIMPENTVDSQAIFYLLNENNNDYKKTFSQLEGAFAIEWIDKRDPNMVYLSTKANPLAIAFVREMGAWFWASTYLALYAVLYSVYGSKGYFIQDLAENTTYKIFPNMKFTKEEVKFGTDPIKKPVFTRPTVTITDIPSIAAEIAVRQGTLKELAAMTGTVTGGNMKGRILLERRYVKRNLKRMRKYFNKVNGVLCYDCNRDLLTQPSFWWIKQLNGAKCNSCRVKFGKIDGEVMVYMSILKNACIPSAKMRKVMVRYYQTLDQETKLKLQDDNLFKGILQPKQ